MTRPVYAVEVNSTWQKVSPAFAAETLSAHYSKKYSVAALNKPNVLSDAFLVAAGIRRVDVVKPQPGEGERLRRGTITPNGDRADWVFTLEDNRVEAYLAELLNRVEQKYSEVLLIGFQFNHGGTDFTFEVREPEVQLLMTNCGIRINASTYPANGVKFWAVRNNGNRVRRSIETADALTFYTAYSDFMFALNNRRDRLYKLIEDASQVDIAAMRVEAAKIPNRWPS